MASTNATPPHIPPLTVRIIVPPLGQQKLVASKDRETTNPWVISFQHQQGNEIFYSAARKKGKPAVGVTYPQYAVETGDPVSGDTAIRTFGLFSKDPNLSQSILSQAAREIAPIERLYYKERDIHLAKTGRAQDNAATISSSAPPTEQQHVQANAVASTSSSTPNLTQSPQLEFNFSFDDTVTDTPTVPFPQPPTFDTTPNPTPNTAFPEPGPTSPSLLDPSSRATISEPEPGVYRFTYADGQQFDIPTDTSNSDGSVDPLEDYPTTPRPEQVEQGSMPVFTYPEHLVVSQAPFGWESRVRVFRNNPRLYCYTFSNGDRVLCEDTLVRNLYQGMDPTPDDMLTY